MKMSKTKPNTFLGKELKGKYLAQITSEPASKLIEKIINYCGGRGGGKGKGKDENVAIKELQTLYEHHICPLHNWCFFAGGTKLPKIFLNDKTYSLKDEYGEEFLMMAIRHHKLKDFKLSPSVLVKRRQYRKDKPDSAMALAIITGEGRYIPWGEFTELAAYKYLKKIQIVYKETKAIASREFLQEKEKLKEIIKKGKEFRKLKKEEGIEMN